MVPTLLAGASTTSPRYLHTRKLTERGRLVKEGGGAGLSQEQQMRGEGMQKQSLWSTLCSSIFPSAFNSKPLRMACLNPACKVT